MLSDLFSQLRIEDRTVLMELAPPLGDTDISAESIMDTSFAPEPPPAGEMKIEDPVSSKVEVEDSCPPMISSSILENQASMSMVTVSDEVVEEELTRRFPAISLNLMTPMQLKNSPSELKQFAPVRRSAPGVGTLQAPQIEKPKITPVKVHRVQQKSKNKRGADEDDAEPEPKSRNKRGADEEDAEPEVRVQPKTKNKRGADEDDAGPEVCVQPESRNKRGADEDDAEPQVSHSNEIDGDASTESHAERSVAAFDTKAGDCESEKIDILASWTAQVSSSTKKTCTSESLAAIPSDCSTTTATNTSHIVEQTQPSENASNGLEKVPQDLFRTGNPFVDLPWNEAVDSIEKQFGHVKIVRPIENWFTKNKIIEKELAAVCNSCRYARHVLDTIPRDQEHLFSACRYFPRALGKIKTALEILKGQTNNKEVQAERQRMVTTLVDTVERLKMAGSTKK